MKVVTTIAQVKLHVALRSGVQEGAFYLVKEGKILQDHETLGGRCTTQDAQIHMCANLQGGVSGGGGGCRLQIPGHNGMRATAVRTGEGKQSLWSAEQL